MSRTDSGEKIISPINGVSETKYSYGKELNWTLIINHTQKSTQNWLKTEIKL